MPYLGSARAGAEEVWAGSAATAFPQLKRRPVDLPPERGGLYGNRSRREFTMVLEGGAVLIRGTAFPPVRDRTHPFPF